MKTAGEHVMPKVKVENRPEWMPETCPFGMLAGRRKEAKRIPNRRDQLHTRLRPVIREAMDNNPSGMELDRLWFICAYVCDYEKSPKTGEMEESWSRRVSGLRLNDVANICYAMGFGFEGLDAPYLRWTPKGHEKVVKRD
jgi:hypothetical protein